MRADRPGAPWGAYGYLLRNRFDGRTYLLGCGHVMASGPAPRIGDRLMLSDGSTAGRAAAHLTVWTAPVPSDAGYPNTVDAALAEIDHPDAIARVSTVLPNGISGDIRSGMSPYVTGAALLNDRGRAVGLHAWGSDGRADDGRREFSVFTPIQTVLDTFTRERELDLVTDTDPVTMPLERPPIDDLDDAIDLVARTLYGEARREPPETRIAIAEVVYNRAMRRLPKFGMSVEAVCRHPDQFSCWNPGNPHRDRTLSISLADPEIAECVTIARALVAGRVGGLTSGADHYHHRRVNPFYSRDRSPCAEIGNYLFFNNIP